MATKNLARTIIEGGRTHYNQWSRNHSHRIERAMTRRYLARCTREEDGFDAYAIGDRPKVYKDFSDRLGAPRRWLQRQVGRHWDEVRSEIFARFDPRSLAGQHIIFDHLLREVDVHPSLDGWSAYRNELYVDEHGILRRRKRRRFRYCYTIGDPELGEAAERWARGRRVREHGQALYWLERAGACNFCRATRDRPCCCPLVDGARDHGPHVHFRQSRRLRDDEVTFWKSLSSSDRALLSGPRVRGH